MTNLLPNSLTTLNSPTPGRSVLARFLELRGRRILDGCGAQWYSVPGGFLMNLPYDAMLDPHPAELREMICSAGARGARFSSLHWNGLPSGLYLLRRGPYSVETIHIKHRPRVRQGLKSLEVRPAEMKELLEQGLDLNRSTMARQGRFDPEFGHERSWRRLVEAAFACPEVSVPAAFAGKRLSAYIITCRENGWLHILHQMSRQEDLALYPNHALTYCVSSAAVEDQSIKAVCYGCISLVSGQGLHEYKLRFGYQVIPHRSAIQLHPALDRIMNSAGARAVVHLLRRIRPNLQTLETIDTVLKGASLSRPRAPGAPEQQ